MIEILVVVMVIAMLVSIVIGVAGAIDRQAAENKAKVQVMALTELLEEYYGDTGEYPDNVTTNLANWYSETYGGAEHEVLGPVLDSGDNYNWKDPWGNFFVLDKDEDAYHVGSYGPDGRCGKSLRKHNALKFGQYDDITNMNGKM